MSGQNIFADVSDQRRALMGKVKCSDTKPELAVRRLLHALGFRYRLHRRDLPGRPDIVLPKYRTALFIHGCFWHRHLGCRGTTTPKTRAEFWNSKFEANVARDQKAELALAAAGWKVAVVWECETKDVSRLEEIVLGRLDLLHPKAVKPAKV
jgi:DNA mismatch endonuclease (patch repair protein)